MAQRITLQTIADETGVSKQTVSNAFSRPDQLSASLRDRILSTADSLGYAGPDPSARALSRGSTGVVGVLLTERSWRALDDPAATEFLIGVAEALEHREHNVLLISGQPEPRFAHTTVAVDQAAVDAFIAYSLSPQDPQLLAARRRPLPLVTVDQPTLDGSPFVGADQRTLASIAAAHLVSLQHSRIGVLAVRVARDGRAGPVDAERLAQLEFPVTKERLAGVAEAGCEPLAVWECPDASAVPAAVDHFLEIGVTAILGMSDAFALAAIDHLSLRNHRTPGDVSVVGIDDIPAASGRGLTTVAQDHRQKGHLAVTAVTSGQGRVLDCALMERSSTASR